MTFQWGLIGGGEGSQIGSAHRIAARLDDVFKLSAGALDVDAAVNPDDLAVHRDERAAGIARVDLRVRLDRVEIAGIVHVAVQRGDR